MPASYHLSTAVPVKSVQYLEWLGLEARSLGGMRLPKALIVRALLSVAMRLEIDVSGVTNQADREKRIWEAIDRRSAGSKGGEVLAGWEGEEWMGESED